MANFPQNVVNLAKRKASELEDRPGKYHKVSFLYRIVIFKQDVYLIEDEVAKKHPKQEVEVRPP